jgi:hypothetical protein
MNYWDTVLDLHKIDYNNDNILFLSTNINTRLFIKVHQKEKYQSGGTKFKYNDYDVTLNSTEDKLNIIYSLNSNNADCLLIVLDKCLKDVAVITGISADYGCYDDNKKKMKGSDLLELAISFIEKRKKFKTKEGSILEIKKIQLKDNSLVSCKGEKIPLSNLYTLVNGFTWYMSRGFMPIGSDDKETGKAINSMFNNKKIIDKITIEDSKIYDFIMSITQTPANKDQITYLITLINKNKHKLLKYLFSEIKDNFKKYCEIIKDLATIFYLKIGLLSFHQYTFILKI